MLWDYTMLLAIQTVVTVTLPILSVFLILLILVQRGRGGGLVGAFGGMGGQSAFGAKAGDLFTRVTVVTVCIWIFLSVVILLTLKHPDNAGSGGFGGGKTLVPSATMPAEPDSDTPVTTPIPAE